MTGRIISFFFVLLATSSILACEWNLIWSDEFKDPILNKSMWKVDADCWGDGSDEQQCYTSRSSNLAVKDDHLVIRVVKEEYQGRAQNCTSNNSYACINSRSYTSARVRSFWKNSVAVGKVSIRARLPKGSGLTTFLSMLPSLSTDVTSPNPNEINIIKAFGDNPSGISGELVYGNGDSKVSSSSGFLGFPCIDDFSKKLHEFELHWSPVWLRWYVDGVLFHEQGTQSFLNSSQRFDAHNTHIAMNIVVGGSDGITPSERAIWEDPTLIVDYVRVYSQESVCDSYSWRNAGDCSESSQPSFAPAEIVIPTGRCLQFPCYDEVYNYLKNVQQAFPEQTRLEQIGLTLEKRPIQALCFGACNVEQHYPSVLFTGMHHSREPMSMLVLLYLLQYIQAQLLAGDLEVQALVSSRQLWFVPVVNPDGYAFNEKYKSWESGDGQRKNRRPGCAQLNDRGVDLNRNYAVCWHQDDIGSNPNPCSEDYRGEAAFSEAETNAIRSLVEAHNFSIALNFHSYGEFINIPYACEEKGKPQAADAKIFDVIAKEMSSTSHYQYGQSWSTDNLYTVNGECSDWMYNAHGIYAMSPETGPVFGGNGRDEFWPRNRTLVRKICDDNLASNLYVAWASGAIYSMVVEAMHRQNHQIILSLKITNAGIRRPNGIAYISGGLYPNGSDSSSAVPISITAVGDAAATTTIQLVLNADSRAAQSAYYIVIKDNVTCFMYRVGVSNDSFQLSNVKRIPLCGSCLLFGAQGNTSMHGTSVDCSQSHSAIFKSPFLLSIRDEKKEHGYLMFMLPSLFVLLFIVGGLICIKWLNVIGRLRGTTHKKYQMVATDTTDEETEESNSTQKGNLQELEDTV